MMLDITEGCSEIHLAGSPISGGVVLGRICMFNDRCLDEISHYHVSDDEVTAEKARVERAIPLAAEDLDRAIKNVAQQIGQAEAQIFEAHKAILTDRSLADEVSRRIDASHVNAETAVIQTLDSYQARLLESTNEYLRQRASDLAEVQRRLLAVLSNRDPGLICSDQADCDSGNGRIIAAEELTPSLTVGLHLDNARAFITERGGPNSHAAILARSLGVPAVSGIPNLREILDCGTEVLVNGDAGEVILWPDARTIERLDLQEQATRESISAIPPVPSVRVLGNISNLREARVASAQQAEGVGLYRTEMEFFSEGRILSEDEQFERYIAVLQAMDERPVCFRLLDIGGDKKARFFDLPEEENPFLGLRGSRLLLERPDLLRPQARALARASAYGPTEILHPMTIDCRQFLQLKAAFQEAVVDLHPEPLRHGVMFEVPSACLQARELLREAEFGSIGTNDLIQFLFAIDRGNVALANHNEDLNQSILWALLTEIVEAARDLDRPLSLCGEMASNTRLLTTLSGLGLTTLSVNPRMIPQLRLAAKRSLNAG